MTFEPIVDAELSLNEEFTINFDDYSHDISGYLTALVDFSYAAELADTGDLLPEFIVFDESGKTFTITPTTAD